MKSLSALNGDRRRSSVSASKRTSGICFSSSTSVLVECRSLPRHNVFVTVSFRRIQSTSDQCKAINSPIRNVVSAKHRKNGIQDSGIFSSTARSCARSRTGCLGNPILRTMNLLAYRAGQGPNGSTKVLQGHRCRTQHRGSGCLIGFIDFLHPAYPFAFGLLSRGTALQNFRLLLPAFGPAQIPDPIARSEEH